MTLDFERCENFVEAVYFSLSIQIDPAACKRACQYLMFALYYEKADCRSLTCSDLCYIGDLFYDIYGLFTSSPYFE